MPLIQISQTAGLSDAVKRETIAAVTDAYAKATGKNPDSVWVTITEIPRSQWGVGGEPLDEPAHHVARRVPRPGRRSSRGPGHA